MKGLHQASTWSLAPARPTPLSGNGCWRRPHRRGIDLVARRLDHGQDYPPPTGYAPPLDSTRTWSATPRRVAGSEDGRQVRRPERPRLFLAMVAGGPPVAGEDPGGAFPGRARTTAWPNLRSAPHRRSHYGHGGP